jgi:hypothetical protein
VPVGVDGWGALTPSRCYQVFTSDFHAGRTAAAMDWAFGLAPEPGLRFGVSVALDVRVGEQLMQIGKF